MQFGIFDHLDHGGIPLRDYYESRLALIEAYDRAGFYAYHVAEHHATPLGMAPSPSVFLAAVAQRTKRLRFGPFVYVMPLYHPLRLLQEICMLDQLSGGRLELGFGRGASPIELAYFGQDPAQAQRIYTESYEIVLKGLGQRTLSYDGEFYKLNAVPVALEPLQQPHPPLWYGVHSPESAARAAERGSNIVTLDTVAETKSFTDRFRAVWRETHGPSRPVAMIGLGRFIVVAETDSEALALARRAYPKWHRSFNYLFEMHNMVPSIPRPPDWDTLHHIGKGIAGSPRTVASYLEDQFRAAGATYLVGQFAFGDLTLAECLRSVGLFTEHVMPALRDV